jgi:hypothetical protein
MNREDRLETAAKCACLADELVEGHGDGECSSSPSIEDYAKPQGLEVHIHYRLRGPDDHCRDYCAVVKAALNRSSSSDLNGGWLTLPPFTADLALLDHRQVFDEKAMFVSYVGFVKEAEGIIAVPARMVRLHILQDCKGRRTDDLIDLLFLEGTGIPANGESGFPHSGRLDTAMVLDHKRPKEMIHGASSIVDAIANDQRPFDHGGRPTQVQSKRVDPMFGIHFFRDAVSLRVINEGGEGCLERVTVMTCARELRAVGP